VLLVSGSLAWTVKISVHRQQHHLSPLAPLFSTDNSDIYPETSSQSRREWLSSIASAAAGLSLLPAASNAASVVTTAAVCDPTVSVWKRGERLVYLLGTAHISTSSADLAAQLVQDTQPNAVFIELDLKRVGGLAVKRGEVVTNRLEIPASKDGSTDSKVIVPKIIPVSTTLEAQARGVSEQEIMQQQQQQEEERRRGGLGQRFLNFGAAAIGSAIRGMYKNLNTQGFQAGQEFVRAVEEGRKIGADIVLGDQDVQITLRRLTQALQVTDLQKLLDPDSPVEQSMRELLPPSANDPDAYKTELASFVESIKTRDRVRKIMSDLNQVAPALVQVMLTERDAYMAAGLNTLNDKEVIVAVMGIAHQDGVENNLRSIGWSQPRLNCPRK